MNKREVYFEVHCNEARIISLWHHSRQYIAACFSSGAKLPLDHDVAPATPPPAGISTITTMTTTTPTLTRSGSGSPQSLIMSVYRTNIASQPRLVTISWCKNLLLHGLSVSVDGPEGHDHYHCKVELKPWYFWRKQGSKQFIVDGKIIGIVWDLKGAKFNGEVEPQSDYYVAIVSEEEVVLVVGDMKKASFRRTGCRPALIDPVLVSRKEHIFGKKRFSTKVKFHERGKCHEISVECNNEYQGFSPEMDIFIDGKLATQVKHLHWKFRGNESIYINETKLEVYWDVHDWIFGSGPRHAMFLFKSSSSPSSSSSSLSPSSSSSLHVDDTCREYDDFGGGVSEFSLFLYAWKVE
ncbi:Autophagy protein 5 [Bienertia sinuspersici]